MVIIGILEAHMSPRHMPDAILHRNVGSAQHRWPSAAVYSRGVPLRSPCGWVWHLRSLWLGVALAVPVAGVALAVALWLGVAPCLRLDGRPGARFRGVPLR